MVVNCSSCGVELDIKAEISLKDKMCLEDLLGPLKVFCIKCERKECGPFG